MRGKNKIKALAFAVIFAVTAALQAVSAGDENKNIQERIWKYQMTQAGVSDYEEYLSTGLVPSAGRGGDWLVIYMKESGIEADYGQYNDALDEYLISAKELSATDYERIGLVKACLGQDKEYIVDTVRNHTGQSGIMSIIYGLMLACSNNYVDDAVLTEIADSLTSLQLEDGGWNLTGQYSDADVTAMALQALAPLYDKGYGENIEKAVARLSELQENNGGYASYGVDNSESTAQVLMALCALDIDFRNDTRFIKNGESVYDALITYITEEGGFSHTQGGPADSMATVQALGALVCAEKYENTGRFLYDFTSGDTLEDIDEGDSAPNGQAEENETGTEIPDEETLPHTGNGISGRHIKHIFMGIILSAAAVIILVMAFRKRLTLIKAIVTGAVCAALMTIVGFSSFETVSEHYNVRNEQGSTETYITVTGINGIIAPRTQVYIETGDTAFDQLLRLAGDRRINIDYSGSAALGTIYVRSIDGLAEFDYGSLSGWTYYVNGKMPEVSCSQYELEPDDEVRWIYSDGTDLTEEKP